jgi:hypothetical protein
MTCKGCGAPLEANECAYCGRHEVVYVGDPLFSRPINAWRRASRKPFASPGLQVQYLDHLRRVFDLSGAAR